MAVTWDLALGWLVMVAIWSILAMYVQPYLNSRRLFALIKKGMFADVIANYIKLMVKEEVTFTDDTGQKHTLSLYHLLLSGAVEYGKNAMEQYIQSNKGVVAQKMGDPANMMALADQFLPKKMQGLPQLFQMLSNSQGGEAGAEGTAQSVKWH